MNFAISSTFMQLFAWFLRLILDARRSLVIVMLIIKLMEWAFSVFSKLSLPSTDLQQVKRQKIKSADYTIVIFCECHTDFLLHENQKLPISFQITFLLFWLITEFCMKFLFLSWTEHAKRQKYVPWYLGELFLWFLFFQYIFLLETCSILPLLFKDMAFCN